MECVESVVREVLYGQAGWPEQPLPGYNRNIVLVEPPLQPKAMRERLAKLFFETFNVTNYFSIDAAVASLYAVGKTSGIVVDVGYDRVDVTPVLEGVVHASSAVRIAGFGGKKMTEMIAAKHGLGYEEAEAKKRGWRVMGDETAKTPDEAAAAKFAADENSNVEELKELEDLMGDEISDRISDIGSACINASIVALVAGEREWRKTLIEGILVCGGGSKVAGLGDRIYRDIMEKHSSGFKPGFLVVPEHMPPELTTEYASWYGGHLIATVVMNPSVVQKHCVTRAEYKEHGTKAVWRKLT